MTIFFSLLRSVPRGLRESASDTESEEDMLGEEDTPSMSWTQPVVTVEGATYDEAKALLSQLRLQTVTQRTMVSKQLNEEELQRRLIERFHKLDCGHISELSEYYIAHHFAMIGDADVLDQLMNKQAQAATTIMNCVDPRFQKERFGFHRRMVQQVLLKWPVYKAHCLRKLTVKHL